MWPVGEVAPRHRVGADRLQSHKGLDSGLGPRVAVDPELAGAHQAVVAAPGSRVIHREARAVVAIEPAGSQAGEAAVLVVTRRVAEGQQPLGDAVDAVGDLRVIARQHAPLGNHLPC